MRKMDRVLWTLNAWLLHAKVPIPSLSTIFYELMFRVEWGFAVWLLLCIIPSVRRCFEALKLLGELVILIVHGWTPGKGGKGEKASSVI